MEGSEREGLAGGCMYIVQYRRRRGWRGGFEGKSKKLILVYLPVLPAVALLN
jgi:hypothetical protein